MHGFTKLFLKPRGTGTKLVWLSVAVNTANGGEPFGKRDGEIHFFFLLSMRRETELTIHPGFITGD